MVWVPFRRAQDPDYESVLASLETQIKARETQLLSIKLRERRATVLALTYGIGACLVYFVLWYFGVLGRGRHGVERLVSAAPLVVGPVLVVFARRILRLWYHRKENREETALRALKKQQRDKVEELKKKTGYYSTRNLLEKYDEGIKKGADGKPVPRTAGTPQRTPMSGSPMSTPVRAGQGQPGTPGSAGPVAQRPMGNLPLLPPAASTPPRRTWMDRVADALLGVEEQGGPNSKYALICPKCYAHNGLVPKEEFDTIQYTCPRCGQFNPKRATTKDSESGHTRRSKSLHVSSTSKLSQSLDAADQKEEEEEVKEALLKDGEGSSTPLRQRKPADTMEVD